MKNARLLAEEKFDRKRAYIQIIELNHWLNDRYKREYYIVLTKNKPLYSKLFISAAALLSILITYTYARSMTVIYGGLELVLAAACYFLIFKNVKGPDHLIIGLFGILTTFSFLNGILYNDLKSVLLLSLSLVLPISISVLNLEFSNDGKEFFWGFLIGFIIILGQSTTGFLGRINSNTFGFYCYMAVSIGFIWYKQAKHKIFPLILILFGCYLSSGAGSRNVAIISLLMFLLLLLPDRVFKSKIFFRVLYIIALSYTVFAANIMEWIFEQEKLAAWLIEYTEGFSDKAWGMEERIGFLREVRGKIGRLNLYNKIFGEGVLKRHGHNMFYQSIFIYGYLGTFLLYALYVRVFEMAYTLIKEENDKIAIGCFIALIGMFLLNGGDLFLVGTETCAIIPQVMMGMIMLRYRQHQQNKKLQNTALESV